MRIGVSQAAAQSMFRDQPGTYSNTFAYCAVNYRLALHIDYCCRGGGKL